MKSSSVTDPVEMHDHKKKVLCFALNKKLKSGKLDQFKLILRKCTKSKSDRKQLLSSFGDVYGSPLLCAIADKKLDFVKYFVGKCGVDVNTEHKKYKLSIFPLWCAFELGHINIVKYLLSKGADHDTVVPYHQHLLIEACKRRHLSLVKYLLQKKNFDVNKTDDKGNNCAYQLFLPKNEIRHILRGKKPKKVPRPSKILPILISHGLDLAHAHVNKKGEPLIQHIIDRRNLPSLRMLEESGPAGMTLECNGLSPIIYAAMDETGEKVVDYLLRSNYFCVSDKILAANLIAVRLYGDNQLQYFIKAIEMRNKELENFNYAENRKKLTKDLSDEEPCSGTIDTEQSFLSDIKESKVC